MPVDAQLHVSVTQRYQQDQCLEDHAERGRSGQHPKLRRGEFFNREDTVVRAPQDQEDAQTQDGDDIVEHRRPHIGTEHAARVQQFAQQVVHPIEENLR